MKNKIHYICVLLLFFSFLTASGQEKQADPKRNAEEQARFEKSIPPNPSKIPDGSQVDPKMDPAQNQVGPTNWKPVPSDVPEKKEVDANPAQVPAQAKSDARQHTGPDSKTQPEAPTTTGKVTNYRDMKGPKTQPEAPKSGNETNYRNVKGSKTQPDAEKPKR